MFQKYSYNAHSKIFKLAIVIIYSSLQRHLSFISELFSSLVASALSRELTERGRMR